MLPKTVRRKGVAHEQPAARVLAGSRMVSGGRTMPVGGTTQPQGLRDAAFVGAAGISGMPKQMSGEEVKTSSVPEVAKTTSTPTPKGSNTTLYVLAAAAIAFFLIVK